MGKQPKGDLVVAIDESGDFSVRSEFHNFYVAAIVRHGKAEQFRRWEAGIPASMRKESRADGEVKGGYLSDDRLHDFVREVLEAEPLIRIVRVAVRPDTHAPGVIAGHLRSAVNGFEAAGRRYRDAGHNRAAAEAVGHARWLRRMSDAQYVKLMTQADCVARSLACAIGHAVAQDFDDELPSLRFKIDRGLIADRPAERRYWKRTVRVAANTMTKDEERIVVPDDWRQTGHPFLTLYGAIRDGQPRLIFDPLFDNRCDFVDSSDHFEVRIADIVASIHRDYFADRRKSVYERIDRAGLPAGRGLITQIVLENSPPPPDEG